MKKILSIILIAFVLFQPVQANAATADDEYLLSFVNAARAEAGLSPLTMDGKLSKAAETRAAECEAKFSHTRPDGTDFYTVDPSCVYGENLAQGQSYHSLADICEQWMLSPSHKANILCADSTKTGFGVYRTSNGIYYVAEEFN